MNHTSTIPAPVMAEMSGVGSFFGSCQIAAGNFEAVLQSATEAQNPYGAVEVVNAVNTENTESAETTEEAEIAETTETVETAEAVKAVEIAKPVDNAKTAENAETVETIIEGAEIVENAEIEDEFIPEATDYKDAEKHIEIAVKNNDNKIVEKGAANKKSDVEPVTVTRNTESEQDLTEEAEPSSILQIFFNYIEERNQNEVLAQLQQILGEEAGAEAFEIVKDLIKKGAPSIMENTDKKELSDLLQALRNMQNLIENKYTDEMNLEEQKAQLDECIEEIDKVLETMQADSNFDAAPLLSKKDIANCMRLAIEIGIMNPGERMPPEHKLFKLINDLLEQKLMTSEDLEKAVKIPYKHSEDYSFVSLDFSEEDFGTIKEMKPEFFRETLENLLECIETENEPEKENLLSMLQQIADLKETDKELKAALDVEDDLDEEENSDEKESLYARGNFDAKSVLHVKREFIANDEPNVHKKNLGFGVRHNFEAKGESDVKSDFSVKRDTNNASIAKSDFDLKDIKDVKPDLNLKSDMGVKNTLNTEKDSLTVLKDKPAKEKAVVPEVRAVWETNGLKIEVVNPKTGEKIQSMQTITSSHNMQERIQEFEVVKQVVAHAKFITTPTGEQKMTIQLRPEHLGQVDMRISLNNGEMQIHARVESATAQAALENHIGLLREGLEKQGITLERLEVSVEQRDRQDAYSLAEKQERHEQRQGNRRRHHGKETHLAVSVKNDVSADTGRRLGYNTMEYLA